MLDLKISKLNRSDENQKTFCPLCGTSMKESRRFRDQGVLHLWFECERLSCNGWIVKKVASVYNSFSGQTFFTFGHKERT
jgi:hypothetical protein